MEKEELKNDPEEYKLIQKNIRKMYKKRMQSEEISSMSVFMNEQMMKQIK